MTSAPFIDQMLQACRGSEVNLLNANVSSLTPSGNNSTLATDQGPVVAKRVVVASGSRLRQLVSGEKESAERGVSQCNWCNGDFFKNERCS